MNGCVIDAILETRDTGIRRSFEIQKDKAKATGVKRKRRNNNERGAIWCEDSKYIEIKSRFNECDWRWMMLDAEPDPFFMVGSRYLGGKPGSCHPNIRTRNQIKNQDDRQEDEGLKKEAADMAKESSSGMGGKNVAKKNDLGLKTWVNSKVSLKGAQKAE